MIAPYVRNTPVAPMEPVVPAAPSPVRTFHARILRRLAAQLGVQAALLVDERDGIVVDAAARRGVDADALAALAASLYRRARLSSAAAGLGEVSFLRLRAQGGNVCAAGRGEVVIVVLAEPEANIGLVRVEMLHAVHLLADPGGTT